MSNQHIGLPLPNHAAAYFDHYLNLATDHTDLISALKENESIVSNLIKAIPAEKENFAYAPEKWTTKGVLMHIIDTERIFQYRTLRLGRNDATSLIGFDENAYEPFSFPTTRSLESINAEWNAIRSSTLALFENFQPENLDFVGVANGHPLSARSAGWIMVGHAKHHLKVLQDKYL